LSTKIEFLVYGCLFISNNIFIIGKHCEDVVRMIIIITRNLILMNFYCFVDVSTDKAIIIKTNKSKINYKNTFNLNVTKIYVYYFKFESYIVWSYLTYVRIHLN